MNSTLFRDLLFILVLGFVAMVVWMLPHLNPPASEQKAEPPGNLIAHIVWPEGNTDVDIWLTGPGEIRPVGYSNKGGLLWNLLRDDLGTMPDATPFNYENAYTRGVIPGEYIINVHCYRCPDVPVKVEIEISIKTGDGDKSAMKILVTTSVDLLANGQEVTAIRFELDSKGDIVKDSMSNTYEQLRSNIVNMEGNQ